MTEDDFNDILHLNPRINSETKKTLAQNVFNKKQEGFKINMSVLTRAFIDKFNEDPEAALEFVGITK